MAFPRSALLVVPLLLLSLVACKIDPLRVVTSGRDGWQLPERVIEALDIRTGDRVAEIGAGNGYWVVWLSGAVGPTGRVYAVEVDEQAIADLRGLVAGEDLRNVAIVYGEFHDPLLPDGQIDLAITSLTYHHIEDRVAYFAALRGDLSERGRVAHLDDRPDAPAPLRWFMSDGHWSRPDAIREEMIEAGYRRVEHFEFLQQQSFQIFAPAPAVGGDSAVGD